MRTFCTGRFEMAEGELLLMINNTFALHFLQATHSENSVNRVWKALAVQPGSAEDGLCVVFKHLQNGMENLC